MGKLKQNRNRMLSVLLSFVMILCMLPLPAVRAEQLTVTPVQPTNGDGSMINPYQLTTPGELYWFADTVNSGNTSVCAVLNNNITVNTGVLQADGSVAKDTTNFAVWTPIGSSTNPYTGLFDGQGYTISGLYLYDASASVGFFRNIGNGGQVVNLHLADSYFSSKKAIGGICVENAGSIVYCTSSATIVSNGSGSGRGGICGYNTGLITGCSNSGSVTAIDFTGGICGVNGSSSSYIPGTIKACFNSGTINGSNYFGGLCGLNQVKSTITDCYNVGIINNTNNTVGGICGQNKNGSTIKNCYNSSVISNTYTLVGAICGDNNAATVTNCVYNNELFTNNAVGNGNTSNTTGIPTADFAQQDKFPDWDFVTIWEMNTAEGRPVLRTTTDMVAPKIEAISGERINASSAKVTFYSNEAGSYYYRVGSSRIDTSGSGTPCVEGNNTIDVSGLTSTEQKIYIAVKDAAGNVSNTILITIEALLQWTDEGNYDLSWYDPDEDTYMIDTGAKLAGVAVLVNGLNGNTATSFSGKTIMLSGDIDLSSLYWTPIGTSSANFKGSFDGNGKIIRNMRVDTTNIYSGLFGYVKGSTIQNCVLTETEVIGESYAAGIVGYIENGNVTNCSVSGSVTGTTIVGGICGIPKNSYVTKCTNYASVTATGTEGKAGGISGDNRGYIDNCVNFGDIKGTEYIGGITGQLLEHSIKNSYNAGMVTATNGDCAGGIAAHVSSDKLVVENCYYLNTTASTGLYLASDALKAKVKEKTADEFASGEVAYLLNKSVEGGEVWYQNLDNGQTKDKMPVLTNTHGRVYFYVQYSQCDKGDADPLVVYSNQDNPDSVPSHVYKYTANGAIITETCQNCDPHSETAKLVLDTTVDTTYTGSEIKPVKVEYSDGWMGGTLIVQYHDNINAADNTAKAFITKDGATAELYFSIAKADPAGDPDVSAVNETIKGKGDGKINGLTTAMEWSTEENGSYTAVTDMNMVFAAGTYYVRYKENQNYNASGATKVEIQSGRQLIVTLPEIQTGYTLTASNSVIDWHGSTILTFTLDEGYSKLADFALKINGTSVTINADGRYTVNSAENDITVTVEGVADITAPSAEIKVKSNAWTKFLNTVTFGLFFKETTDVTVTASDAGSGVAKVEYMLSESRFDTETAIVGKWTTLTENGGVYQFSIQPNNKCYVYVRVTDRNDNIKVLNSDGIVVYTDAEQDTESITFTKLSEENVSFQVKLNGNTVKAIYLGETEIGADNYTISGNTVTLKAAYLQTLAAQDTPYTLRVTYNPMGESYAADDENDAPAETTVKLTVKKVTGTVSITSNPGKTYDKTAVTTLYNRNNTSGEAVIEYKEKGKADSPYTTEAPMNAGDYTVRVTINEDSAGNYTKAVSETVDFTIERKSVTITGTTVKASKVYDGNRIAEITDNGTILGNLDGENLKAEAGKATYNDKNVGNGITVNFSEFTLSGDAANNYKLADQPASVTANITAKELTVSVSVENKQYDGLNTAKIALANLNGKIDGDDAMLVNGTPSFTSINVGNDIPVSFTVFSLDGADKGNYSLKQPTGVTANIYNLYTATKGIDYTVNSNEWIRTDFTVTAKEGYLLSLTDTDSGDWKRDLKASAETADGELRFYVRNESTKAISLAVNENYKIDKTAPTGKVEFVGRKSWQEFVNVISFGLFFKDEVTVKAAAQDSLSGVSVIEYYASADSLDLDDVKAITDDQWTAMPDNGVGVTLEDTKQFIYYIRITDNAGNVTHLSTDGAEYDTTAPVIEGVTDGESYYSTQKVTVTDKNLDTVTVNDIPVTLDENGSFTLAGNTDAEYKITAADKADNETVFTVMMKTISALVAPIKDITVDHVTSEDKEAIEQVAKDIDEELGNENLTDEEKEILEEEKQKAQDLLDRIDEAADAINTENTEKVKDITAENVTPDDKSDLEKAKEDLEKALDNYTDNYTDEEKKAIKDDIDRIDKALKVIESVETVEEMIDSLPDTVTKEDSEKIKAAEDAYNALTDYEKSIVDKDAKAKLEKAISDLAKLHNSSNGQSPQTGDNSNLFLWVALLFVSAFGVAGRVIYSKRKRA